MAVDTNSSQQNSPNQQLEMARTLGAKAIPASTRVAVVAFLATRCKEGHLRYCTVSLAVKVFRIRRAAIKQIWALRNDPSSLVRPRKAYPRRPTRLNALLSKKEK
ncbi:hypothetical protein F441_17199 [Phytophthora nicotianae CJ01A1]|uniref:Transposase Tc1-like domain-containing protein n=1 Tax=Phytophthora nicotianae CJ01A1 TaxID=1317063 RepID=W2WA26_PHYNI|nr:hypothetical protein F441_17199 [Phytophthora nicotianae CJ01A1]